MANNFYKWFTTFIEEKGIDMAEPLRDGVQVGDVCQAIVNAPASEQNGIKAMIVKIDFVNGDVVDYFRHLSNALSADFIQKQRSAMVNQIFGGENEAC